MLVTHPFLLLNQYWHLKDRTFKPLFNMTEFSLKGGKSGGGIQQRARAASNLQPPRTRLRTCPPNQLSSPKLWSLLCSSWDIRISTLKGRGRPGSCGTLGFVHPVKGDGDVALHVRPGDLWQILGVEDEEIRRPLGAGSRHDGQQHTCRHSTEVIISHVLS